MRTHHHLSIPITIVSIALLSSSAFSDVRINGFASFVGGATTSEGSTNDLITGEQQDATFISDFPTNGRYNDEISFRPDTILGIQASADIFDGLSITGQITGSGGESFDANIAWAYLTYEFNENVSVLLGKQRLPLFFYSDFLDVGYSYHWIRPPIETSSIAIDDYEGIQLQLTTSSENWDSRFQLYTGASSAVSPNLGALGLQDSIGFVAYTSNDWLQLRATVASTDSTYENPQLTTQGEIQDKDNPVPVVFGGVAVHATFNKLFIVTEAIFFKTDEPIASDVSLGESKRSGFYISTGYRIGNFTPHITFAQQESESASDSSNLLRTNQSTNVGTESWTIGLRWDFHSNATFKVEYLSREDTSDDFIKNNAGIGNVFPGGYAGGQGDLNEVDVFTFGIDLIF